MWSKVIISPHDYLPVSGETNCNICISGTKYLDSLEKKKISYEDNLMLVKISRILNDLNLTFDRGRLRNEQVSATQSVTLAGANASIMIGYLQENNVHS
jgi:hypothetical protein